jgi:multimeric flavodoxin WrbA
MKILSICGSPRKGNSEAVILKLQKLLKKKGVDNEIILLREKHINLCGGCVEYCNHKLQCRHQDDMPEIMKKIEHAEGYIFVTPNYFQMPPAIFKNFIDRCSIFFTRGDQNKVFNKKKAAVICVGTDSKERIQACTDAIADRFCKTLGLPVVVRKTFRSNSELKGNYNDIFENGKNPKIMQDLQEVVQKLILH